jgi:hypothetical protein
MGFLRRLFGGSVTNGGADGEVEARREATQVWLSRLAEAIRSGQEEVAALTRRVKALEANEAGREAGLLDATVRIQRVVAGLRRTQQAERQRLADRDTGDGEREGSGDGDTDDDWLGGYRALRGWHSRAPASRTEALLDDEEEDLADSARR